MHDSIKCLIGRIPIDEWCEPCCAYFGISPVPPVPYRNYSHERGDWYEQCDICERVRFDVQSVYCEDISLGVCGGCRFNAAIEEVKYEAYIERTAREEQEWLESGGQELIDNEPYVWPDKR
jgi:hypothetical protein